MKLEHVVLIGLNFQMEHSTGDKNYWLHLIPLLAKELKHITIISIRDHNGAYQKQIIESCTVEVIYLSPKFLESSSSGPNKIRKYWKQGAFPSWLGVVEKTMNAKALIRILKKIHICIPYQYIHLMDNMGLTNSILARTLESPVSVSAMAYQGKKPKWFYENYLRISYKVKNLTVVPYSKAFASKLSQIGINSGNICRIPWGVYIDSTVKPNPEIKISSKKALGLPPKKPLILWTGYIQQITREDFLFAYKQALGVCKSFQATFYFAFKPESFESDFVAKNIPEQHVYVTPTDPEKFEQLMSAADILYSPVVNSDCIVAPPLTWIEIMSRGTPIITTSVLGANEIIENGKTGTISNNIELINLLTTLTERPEEIYWNCVKNIQTNYNIQHSAKAYLQLWKEGL